MKIGMISKQEHCKPHAERLRGEGHEVVLLGGGCTEIPSSMDLVVCRPESASHTAFKTAIEAKRRGDKVVIADGVTGILEGVKSFQPQPPEEEEDVAEQRRQKNRAAKRPPVVGVYHRAYWNKNAKHWNIRVTEPGGPPWKKSAGTFRGTREEAREHIQMLDAKEQAEKEQEEQAEKKAIPAGSPPEETPQREKSDIPELLNMLAEEMLRLNLVEAYNDEVGIRVVMEPTHLEVQREQTFLGVACGSKSHVRYTTTLSMVNCPDCMKSEVYKTIQRYLASYSA